MPYAKIRGESYTIIYDDNLISENDKKDFKYYSTIPHIEKLKGFKYLLTINKEGNLEWLSYNLPEEIEPETQAQEEIEPETQAQEEIL